jgi:hypothetical protein
MSSRKKTKPHRVLSPSMTMSDLEDWFEAEFAKMRRRRIRRNRKPTAIQPKKEQRNA